MEKSNRANRFSTEVRARAVRMVLDNEGEHSSRWSAIVSISGKIGCVAQTLNEWIKLLGEGHIPPPIARCLSLRDRRFSSLSSQIG